VPGTKTPPISEGKGRYSGNSPSPISALVFPEHADDYRPKDLVLLAVDQQFGEAATLWVAPRLSDRVSPVEVGEQEDVE
jgi:hypothetical protein